MMESQSRLRNNKIKLVIFKSFKSDFMFDEKRMQQVLVNLLSNAIKFSH